MDLSSPDSSPRLGLDGEPWVSSPSSSSDPGRQVEFNRMAAVEAGVIASDSDEWLELLNLDFEGCGTEALIRHTF